MAPCTADFGQIRRSGHGSASSTMTKKSMQISRFLIPLLMALLMGAANASSNPQPYTLDWPVKGEQLTYRSCGCADACWVAELQSGNRKKLKATLRCDCSSLYVIYPANATEQKLAESCSMNDGPDKMAEISSKMKAVVEDKPKRWK